MAHAAKNYDALKGGAVKGLSDAQLDQHFTLYKGYVAKLNEIEEKLASVDNTKPNYSFNEYSELKRREAVAFNGSFLHELYFENLGGKGGKATGKLSDMIARDFGSFDKWTENFKACGMAARGWVVLGVTTYDGKLHNYCLDTHNFNVPWGCIPLLVMDVYEHAYTIDYGVKRPPYIDAFMKNINWAVCSKRLDKINIEDILKVAAS